MTKGALISLSWLIVAAFLCLLLPGRASATNQITGGCSSSSSGLTMPSYDLLTKTQQTGTGSLSIQCTGTGTVNVQASLTLGSGSCVSRNLKNGANVLTYVLSGSSGYSPVWCEPTRVTVTFTFSSPSIPETQTIAVPIYGRVDSGQSGVTGTYSDTIGTAVYWSGGNSTTSTFTVQEAAVPGCTLAVNSLSFGTYTGALATGQGGLTVTCTSSAPFTLALGSGSNYSATRRMTASSQYIAYSLYQDAAYTTLWGDGVTAGAKVSSTGTGSAQTFIVYGKAPAQTVPPPGAYTDNVVVTVTY